MKLLPGELVDVADASSFWEPGPRGLALGNDLGRRDIVVFISYSDKHHNNYVSVVLARGIVCCVYTDRLSRL